jgi:hypothetical protein
MSYVQIDQKCTRKRRREALRESISLEVGWEDNIKIVLKEIGSKVVDWIQLTPNWVKWRELFNAAVNSLVLAS